MNVSQLISMTFKAAVDRFILKKLCINHEKTKTTFTKPGTVCEGGLRIYCGFHSCWCFYAFFLCFCFFLVRSFCFHLFVNFFFVQTSISAAILCSFIRLSIFSIIFII